MYPYKLRDCINIVGNYRAISDTPPTKPPMKLPYVSREVNYRSMSSCIGRWTFLSFKYPSASAGLWIYITDLNISGFSGYVLSSGEYNKYKFEYSQIEHFMFYLNATNE